MSNGRIKSVNISERKGTAKIPVGCGALREDWGFEGDSHAGKGDRQVSLLAWESVERQIERMRRMDLKCPKKASLSDGSHPDELAPGDYAENLTVEGVDLIPICVGDRVSVGLSAILEVTRIGKECHQHCEIYKRLGDCVMPREGVFARVVRGGAVSDGDEVRIAARSDSDTE